MMKVEDLVINKAYTYKGDQRATFVGVEFDHTGSKLEYFKFLPFGGKYGFIYLTKKQTETLIQKIGEFYPCKPDIFEATYEEVKDE